jgi:hypothetical protein
MGKHEDMVDDTKKVLLALLTLAEDKKSLGFYRTVDIFKYVAFKFILSLRGLAKFEQVPPIWNTLYCKGFS